MKPEDRELIERAYQNAFQMIPQEKYLTQTIDYLERFISA